jgi:hypothetical protein
MSSGFPNWLGSANGVQLPNFVTYNGQTVNPIMNVSTTSKTIASFGVQNSFSNYYIVPVIAGTYFCGATVYGDANGTAWSANDGIRFRIIDSNADAASSALRIYPEIDVRPYYLTVDGVANTAAVANNNVAGIFTCSSNVNLCWQAAISNSGGVPATHKVIIEAPFWQKIA